VQSRTVIRAAVVATVVLAAYGGGVLTGVLADHPSPAPAARPPAPVASESPDVLDEAANTIQQNAANPISKADLEKAAVEGMLQALGDRWSSYFTPNDFSAFQDVIDGQYTGVGLWVHSSGVVPTGATMPSVTVMSVQTGSPADAAGLHSGDQIVAVGGTSMIGHSVADVVTALRGAAGSTVAVVYQRAGHTHTVTLRRTSVSTQDVTAKVTGSVMVIKINSFSRGVGSAVQQFDATARTRKLAGIVLDLRGNPGGLLNEGVATASVFLDGGRVVTFERRGAAPLQLEAPTGGDTGMPLAVLVDGGTASAAEVVTAALQDRDRAVIVGSQTFGKGSVQEPEKLADGSAIELTVGSYRTPDGRSLDGVGIHPDVVMPAGTPPSVAEAQAVEVISGLMADAGTGGHG
jgi:carboxyl-terminal processing protease